MWIQGKVLQDEGSRDAQETIGTFDSGREGAARTIFFIASGACAQRMCNNLVWISEKGGSF